MTYDGYHRRAVPLESAALPSSYGTRGLGRLMSAAHSGQIQTYLSVIAIGVLALLLFYAWLA